MLLLTASADVPAASLSQDRGKETRPGKICLFVKKEKRYFCRIQTRLA